MVEFWIMIAVVATSGTVTAMPNSPPVYYTRELCEAAGKNITDRTGQQYMCTPARPVVTMMVNDGYVIQVLP